MANRALSGITAAALIAGTIDFIYASTFFPWLGVPFESVWKSVASGWLGKPALDGDLKTVALGIGLHYLIMFLAATTFYLIARRMEWVPRRPVLAGILFGLGMYVVMSFVVLPLSAFPFPYRFSWVVGPNLALHTLGVGVPMSLALRGALLQGSLKDYMATQLKASQ